MAKESANKIYNEKVKHTGTPFHVWLTAEKQLYRDKKGINADGTETDDEATRAKAKNDFDFYLQSRYRAGGKDLWPRTINRFMNTDAASSKTISQEVFQTENIQSQIPIKEKPDTTEKPVATNNPEPKLPFLKRKGIGGMSMPVTLGLGTAFVTSLVIGGITIYRFSKKNKKAKE